jgi:hypothetical protein
MRAPKAILDVWKQFDGVPMETLTKAWFYEQPGGRRQRTVQEIKEHRSQYGTSGNCFDLAIWLLSEFHNAGIDAHAVGHDLFTPKAHVAVVAYDSRGYRYLCDLGDQWIMPILLDSASEDFVPEPVSGFFPGALVQVQSTRSTCDITYYRPTGKVSRQSYLLKRIETEDLIEAGHYSQRLLRTPLCEMRVYMEHEVAHWEFCDGKSFISTIAGLQTEEPLDSMEAWAARIHERTGMDPQLVKQALEIYSRCTQ